MPNSASPPEYTITYIIHGDANYLYHDADGNALQADEHILSEAKKVAEQATKGEVFIFHQQPERKILWLFPKKDRQFFYYRNGEKIYEQKYSPGSKTQPFTAEAEMYSQLHSTGPDTASHKNVILYFGHEVPQHQRGPYHLSRPDAVFDTESFSQGLHRFLQPGENKFDLAVLSTCNNGTPAMIHALSPFTDYVLASPQNLHLSHIDTQALQTLNQAGSVSTQKLADDMAKDTYQRLTSFLQTMVTLSVYDTDRLRSYLPGFNQDYSSYLVNQPAPSPVADNIDCATLSFFDDQFKDGLQVWYKPPQFGSKRKAASYSGWGCRE